MAKVRVSGVPYEVDMPEDEALKAYAEFSGNMRSSMERWLYFKAGWTAAIKHMETKNDSE